MTVPRNKHETLTSGQRVIRGQAIHANLVKGKATQPIGEEIKLDWLPIDENAAPFGDCVAYRRKFGRERCFDARCDRCYPAMPEEANDGDS